MIFKITESMYGVALYGQYNVVVYLCREKPSLSDANSPRGTYPSNTLVVSYDSAAHYVLFYPRSQTLQCTIDSCGWGMQTHMSSH